MDEERKGLKRENVHRVFFPAEFDLAIVHLQSKMEIGEHASILLVFCEGLKHLSLIDDPTYELFKTRYSRKLLDIVRENREKREKRTRPKFRCSFAKGSADRCRRLAVVMMKKEDRTITSCSGHIMEFEKHGYEIVEKT